MWTNFHSHSQFCDGQGDLSSYVDQASKENMVSIGFSSHAPVPFPCPWSMKKDRLHDYIKTIGMLKTSYPSCPLYSGLEVDYVPGLVSPADFKSSVDYVIGSIHFVDAFADGTPWEIDGSPATFSEGLSSVFQNNIRHAITRYFELTRLMIEKACPDIIGHLDKIKIQNSAGRFYSETDAWYTTEIDKTLDIIAESGAIVEVNTRGLYLKRSATPYPSPWILERMLKRNIPVTLSSDAHKPGDLTSHFSFVAGILLQIGYKKISILSDNTWQPVNLTTHGVTPPIGNH
jgi:histidinol-phosphatase (PHP family)